MHYANNVIPSACGSVTGSIGMLQGATHCQIPFPWVTAGCYKNLLNNKIWRLLTEAGKT
jgi:hypothetical protein